MINVKDQVFDAMKKITENVSGQYPRSWAVFPCIQLTEEENNAAECTDNQETMSYLRYRIDIWSNDTTSSAALAVDKIMSGFGFRRSSCADVDDPSGLNHKQMRYEAYIDCDNEQLYQEI